MIAACIILRQETDDSCREAEAGEIAEQDHQHPDENEDTIFEPAHHAGKYDLRDESESGASDADGEGDQRHALRDGLSSLPVNSGASLRRYGDSAVRSPDGSILSAV